MESIENTDFQYFPFLFISCIIERENNRRRRIKCEGNRIDLFNSYQREESLERNIDEWLSLKGKVWNYYMMQRL